MRGRDGERRKAVFNRSKIIKKGLIALLGEPGPEGLIGPKGSPGILIARKIY